MRLPHLAGYDARVPCQIKKTGSAAAPRTRITQRATGLNTVLVIRG